MRSQTRRFFITQGVVVRTHNLGEADRIVVLLTPDRGLISCVALSARKPSSKTGGHVDLLQHVSISATGGRSDLHRITQAETIDAHLRLRSNLDRLSLASHIAESCERFSAESVANPTLFQLLVESLKYVETAEVDQFPLLRLWHEMRLLTISGFRPELQRCVRSGEALPPDDHWFSPAEGGVIMRRSFSQEGAEDEIGDAGAVSSGSGNDATLQQIVVDPDPALSAPLIRAGMNAIKLLRYISNSDLTWQRISAIKVRKADATDAQKITTALLTHIQERGPTRSERVMNEIGKFSLARNPRVVASRDGGLG